MIFIAIIFILLFILFFINKKCTELNHSIIDLFLENRLIVKILKESTNFSNSISLHNNLQTIEDFFDVKIYIWDPANNHNTSLLTTELVNFLKSERLAIINNNYHNKLHVKYIFDASSNINKLHFSSYKLSSSQSNMMIMLQEKVDMPLSNFDITSSMPFLIKILYILYEFELNINSMLNVKKYKCISGN
jgi:hypothetical protein